VYINCGWRKKKTDAMAIPITTNITRCSLHKYSTGFVKDHGFCGGFGV
jgi:hypothetical protein